MLIVKALHISLVVSWFAGLFYLPRIFVNLAMVPAESTAERERLLLMAGKLFRFMTPLGILAVLLGLWLWLGYGFSGGWLHAKTTLVAMLGIYHWHCGRVLSASRLAMRMGWPALCDRLRGLRAPVQSRRPGAVSQFEFRSSRA